MSDKEILERAIQKAIDGGWKPHTPTSYLLGETNASTVALCFDPEEYEYTPFEWLIFNHDFAKALWGEDIVDVGILTNSSWQQLLPKYEWHLSEMVRADDPIKYLGENL